MWQIRLTGAVLLELLKGFASKSEGKEKGQEGDCRKEPL